jgi:hypothetical protein
MLAPLAGLVALAVGGLTGCAVGDPSPTPTASPSASPTPTTPVVVAPTEPPTTVDALPATALMRISVTAEADGEEVRLELTFDGAQTGSAAAAEFAAVQEACPHAIAGRLDIYPNLEPTGVITSQLTSVGTWPDGMTVDVSAGGTVASYGTGANVAPSNDQPGAFGCTLQTITGPGTAAFTTLLLGDPKTNDLVDLDQQTTDGIFGFWTNPESGVEVRWTDCIVQLSSLAQRLSIQGYWAPPAVWGDGCLIGAHGTV